MRSSIGTRRATCEAGEQPSGVLVVAGSRENPAPRGAVRGSALAGGSHLATVAGTWLFPVFGIQQSRVRLEKVAVTICVLFDAGEESVALLLGDPDFGFRGVFREIRRGVSRFSGGEPATGR